MRAIAKSGATVIFVSHNLQAVAEFCHRAILLEGGESSLTGQRTRLFGVISTPSEPGRTIDTRTGWWTPAAPEILRIVRSRRRSCPTPFAPTRGKANRSRIGQGLPSRLFRKRRGFIIADELAAVDVTIAIAVLQRNAPLPAGRQRLGAV